jgi:hypothetical protein
MDDLFRAAVVIVLGNVLLVPFCLAQDALFSGRLARTRALAAQMPGRSLLVGLVNLLFFGAVALAFSASADRSGSELLRLPAIILVAGLAVGLSLGLTAMAGLVGARLRPQASAVSQMAWGALTLSLGSTLPVVGWFALLPYIAGLGLGAFIISFVARPQPRPDAE